MLVAKAVFVILFPVAVFIFGGALMQAANGRRGDEPRCPGYAEGSASSGLGLNFGYSFETAKSYWDKIGEKGRACARDLLALDMLFPILYTSALGFSLLVVWDGFGRPVSPLWFLVPLLFAVVGDWAENLIQMNQLSRYMSELPLPPQSGWVSVASVATQIKIASLVSAYIALVLFTIVFVVREFSRGTRSPLI